MTAHAKALTERAKAKLEEPAGGETQSAGIVRIFADALEKLGYPIDSLLAQADLRRSDLEDPDARVACSALGSLLAAAMRARPINNIGMRLAAETPIGAFPLVDYLVLTSENVGAGLRQLARYLRLVGAPYVLEARDEEDPVRILYENPLNSFVVEFGITLTLLHLGKETEGLARATMVSFSHQPDDAGEFERILRSPVRTGSTWNGFALTREAWRLPLRRRDPILRSVLEKHADAIAATQVPAEGVVLEVRRTLASRIAKADTGIQSVARALATSVRSLQRRLAEAGVTYQALLDVTRREAADGYLSMAKFSIGEVAYLLGYSEPAAFHRAFRRWNGVTPQAYRERLRRR